MQKKFNDKIYMYEAVLRACKRHETAWLSMPAFVSAYQKLSDNVDLLKLMAKEHEMPVTVSAIVKQNARNVLMEKFLLLAGVAKSHALLTDNVSLMIVARHSKSALNRKTERNLISISQDLADLLAPVIGDLAAYNLDQTTLDDFNASIIAFDDLVSTPRNAIVQKRVLTARIAALIRETDSFLRITIDPAVRLFVSSHPDFYNEYRFARKVVYHNGKPSVVSGSNGPSKPVGPARDDGAGTLPEPE